MHMHTHRAREREREDITNETKKVEEINIIMLMPCK